MALKVLSVVVIQGDSRHVPIHCFRHATSGSVPEFSVRCCAQYAGLPRESRHASGQPITATLSITFRIYDTSSGGSALWTETQNAVAVDGGNLAVELGMVTPLPANIWGQKLYLGVQIAGDSEMLPRPPLTAAPYALRAGGTMRNTVVVSAQGTDAENGIALLAALPQLAVASAINPMVLELDAGIFDIGNQRLELPSFVTIAGAGRDATLITSVFNAGTLLLASNAHARKLTARNTGIPPTDNDIAFGIGASDATTTGLVQNISLEDVVGESVAAPGTTGARVGILLCTEGSRVAHSFGRGEGGNFSFGMRSDCGNNANSRGLFIDGLALQSTGGALGVRGAYIAGGGPWSDIKVFVDANATANSVYGVRVFRNTIDAGAAFLNLFVSVNGKGTFSTVPGSIVEGVRIESADVNFKNVSIGLERVEATSVVGLRVNADMSLPGSIRAVDMIGAVIEVSGRQRAELGPGDMIGVRAVNSALQLSDAKITVNCLAVGYNGCIGVRRQAQGAGLQPGTLRLENSSITVGHVDPGDTSAQSRAYEGVGSASIVNSNLRVVLSPDEEGHAGVLSNDVSADIRVQNSSIEIVSSATPLSGCAIGGASGTIQVMSSHVQGTSCTSGMTLTCYGNTRQGVGFIANGCP